MSADDTTDDGTISAFEDSLGPDDRAREEARRAVSAAILRMAHAAGAPVDQRAIFPGSAFTVTETEPLAGIGFALMLTGAARHKLQDYLTQARQSGAGWEKIGRALGLERAAEERGSDLGTDAFEYAAGAPAQPFDRLWFGWTCPDCLARVIDYGPYGGHPEDCESGHAEGCQRMAAAVAAYQAQWVDED